METVPCGTVSRTGYQYFKAIIPDEIHTGAQYLYSYISFAGENNPKYIFKSGTISAEEVKRQIGDASFNFSWTEKENTKKVSSDKNSIINIWGNNVLCYFGPDRYEKPSWMGDKYYRNEEYLHPAVRTRYSGELYNPIEVKNVTSVNLQWLLDIIADSRAEVELQEDATYHFSPSVNLTSLFMLKQSRANLETILSRILGEDVYFRLNYRNSGGARFRILRKSDNSIVCPSLDSLSTGQIALFNLFATIVRYADNNNINQSINLNNISGIVVVDEIELHLHSKLQKEILPNLIKLFPKVQFVMTSHAPLFLMGMKDVFGENGFEIYELPSTERISVERFSEFSRAYDYIKETQLFQEDVKSIVDSIPQGEKPLVITEGFTDWKHMKAAFTVLRSKEENRELFEDLSFEFLEYEPKNSSSPSSLKIEMGNDALVPLCESLAKIPHERKYIIIADRDTPRVSKKLVDESGLYKRWNENTYSAILPIPNIRSDTPEICIEHYYSDAEIEKEVEVKGIKRHLFMGKDFNTHGYNFSLDRFCERKDLCGPGKNNILDGSQGERIRKLSDENDTTNYALPKSDFVNYVISHTSEFDFTNFIPLFRLIKTIINGTE